MPISPLRPGRSPLRPPTPSALRAATARTPRVRPAALVVGDLLLDIVASPEGPLVPTTEIAGRIVLTQGGAAATTARWLARLGVTTTLVTSVGRDAAGRALIDTMRGHGVVVHAARPAGERTGRTVILALETGRSLISDRGAADALPVEHLRADWFHGVDLVHLPGFASVSEQLSAVGRTAVRLARAAGAIVSMDLPASEAVAQRGYRRTVAAIRELAPDIVFGTPAEVHEILPGRPLEALLDLAPTVVVKRGANGATALTIHDGTAVRLEVATKASPARDATGAGDAFDAGFIASWLAPQSTEQRATLQKAVATGHRVAMRHLESPRQEIRIG